MKVDVVTRIDKNMLSWFGQVERRDETRFNKQMRLGTRDKGLGARG